MHCLVGGSQVVTYLRRWGASLLILVLLAIALGAACISRTSQCPPETVLEQLHDAAFHLDQRDDDQRVRADVEQVRKADAGAWAMKLADRMESALADDGGSRQFDAETIRADLHESPCLTGDAHRRFHQRLPSLRGHR